MKKMLGLLMAGVLFSSVSIAQVPLTSDNINSYAPTLTGTGASGTWGINISGTAASATNWAGQYYTAVEKSDAPLFVMAFESPTGLWKPTNAAGIKSWLGIPTGGETFQSVMDRGNTTTNIIRPKGVTFSASGTSNEFQLGTDEMSNFYIFNGAVSRYDLAIKNNGNVGIGTASPAHKLDVNGNIFSTGKIIAASGIGFRNSTYVIDAANPIWSFENASQYGLAYYQGSTAGYDRIGFHFGDINNPPFYIKDNGSGYFAGDVTIGTTTVQKLLAVNGNIKTRKVTVTQNSWPDYVFDSSYQLTPLRQVEKYIQQNKHLPDVPSAAEVKKEGIDLGDNQAVLLKKIEELTLYIIEQNKKLDAVCQEVKALKENRK
jgi:hypothetical protein